MKSVHSNASASGNLHADGAIRCPYGFHSVLTDENDRVEIRARAAVRGDQLPQVPIEAINWAFQAALGSTGVEFTDAEVVVFPPLHDCEAPMDAE